MRMHIGDSVLGLGIDRRDSLGGANHTYIPGHIYSARISAQMACIGSKSATVNQHISQRVPQHIYHLNTSILLEAILYLSYCTTTSSSTHCHLHRGLWLEGSSFMYYYLSDKKSQLYTGTIQENLLLS